MHAHVAVRLAVPAPLFPSEKLHHSNALDYMRQIFVPLTLLAELLQFQGSTASNMHDMQKQKHQNSIETAKANDKQSTTCKAKASKQHQNMHGMQKQKQQARPAPCPQ